MLNNVTVMGRPGREPEIRWTNDDSPRCVARFSIAQPKSGKAKDDTNWFNIIAFGTVAERVEKYVRKGKRIIVSGSLNNNSYTNKNGEKVSYVEIIANSVEIVDFVAEGENSGKNGNGSEPSGDSFMDMSDLGAIPFN